MNMNFWLEISGILTIVSLSLFLSEYLIPRKKSIQLFFERNKKYFSPNQISSWRKKYGIPTALIYFLGFYLQNEYILYFSIWFFTFLAITDRLDGQIARFCNQETPKGRIYDAECDKWLDLPQLNLQSILQLYFFLNPLYLLLVLPMTIFDIIGQNIRGKNSPAGAELVGKIKTTLKFITVYLMTIEGRYDYGYDLLELNIVIIIFLFSSTIAAGLSMAMKTKWYNDNYKKYLETILR